MLSRRAILAAPLLAQPKPISALLLDGINNHDWHAGTRFIKEVLEATGRFTVQVSTTPPREAPAGSWSAWRPQFKDYQVVINNFNGGHTKDGIRWPREVEVDFVNYIKAGGGLVNFHAANNAFLQWPEYNEIVGLLWRDKTFGPGLIIEDNKPVVVDAGDGPGPGHGPRHDFRVDVFNTDHPITRQELPLFWTQKSEQLTHGQHGPASAMSKLAILTYAHSKDTKRNEPMDWVRSYGKARVYTTMLGHSWKDEPNPNFEVPAFRTLLARAAEWAATGKVIPKKTNTRQA